MDDHPPFARSRGWNFWIFPAVGVGTLGVSSMNAAGGSPHFSSGLATTAHAATAGFARGVQPGWEAWGNQADKGYRPTWKTYAHSSSDTGARPAREGPP